MTGTGSSFQSHRSFVPAENHANCSSGHRRFLCRLQLTRAERWHRSRRFAWNPARNSRETGD